MDEERAAGLSVHMLYRLWCVTESNKNLRLVEDVQKPFRTLGHGSNAQGTILFLVKTEHEYSGQTQSEFAARLK